MRRRRVLALLLAAGASPGSLPSVAHAQPSADQLLTEMRLSPADRQRVLSGEFVTGAVPAVSERDLSFAIAFLVKTSPESLAAQVVAGDLITADAQVKAHGEIKGAGSLADFAGLTLTADEANALAGAKAGGALNLSAGEISAFAGAPPAAAEQQLRTMLLARYQAYRASGLAGIAPYDRGSGRTTDHAADLRKASEATPGLKKYLPAFQALLLGYPKAAVAQMRESFVWTRSVIEGRPTYILTHVTAVAEGGARVIGRRQYYASTGYNGEQSVAGFLPVQGGAVVVVTSHAFTDQVAGFGGSMKRTIGSKVMESKMREIYEAGRTSAAGRKETR